ncbi:hypothetical protein G7Y89_g10281 [Cudoniella acicularis]|uniref:Malic acid transport protein n=1 Tax=Cudoniella acicularis TaxID=354080 RepID=A0A8H4RD22_9HELO|nr:hypothetical protein G7Y89_g10281 [Cudoniella acicularis]
MPVPAPPRRPSVSQRRFSVNSLEGQRGTLRAAKSTLVGDLGIRDRIHHFTWAWFTLSMSTGGIGLLLAQTPHRFSGLTVLGEIVFILDLVLFLCLCTAITTRFILFRKALMSSLKHPTESLFFPTFWISISNIISNVQGYGVPRCGDWLVVTVRVLFWTYLACTFCVAVGQYLFLFTGKSLTIQAFTPAWILPVFPVMLTGTLASLVSSSQPPQHALPIMVAGITFQGLGILIATYMYGTYLGRLMTSGLPRPDTRPGMFIAVGPPSFTGLALLGISQDLSRIYPSYGTISGISHPDIIADVFRIVALCTAIFLWATAFWFFSIALVSVLYGVFTEGMSFHQVWWSFVFPNVGFTIATINIGNALMSEGIRWLGSVMTILIPSPRPLSHDECLKYPALLGKRSLHQTISKIMFRSQLNDNPHPLLEPRDGGAGNEGLGIAERRTASRSPSKARSLSDGAPPTLSPSPKFREPEQRKSKDDSAISDSPTTPRRAAFPVRGLSLQMPARDLMSPNTSAYISRVPLSPKLDHSQTYGSPTSVLPRRSRGLDFSRAATNLHHSTLAEQSSPDSSPTISGRAMNIPNKKNGLHFSNGSESLNNNSSSLWSTMANADRVMVSGSLGSVNMMGSDSSGSDDDDDDLMDADDIDDSILTTPQVGKMSTPFGAIPHASPGSGWAGPSPAVSSLMNFQRARLRHGKSRKSSSSGSGNSMASPSSKSPPAMRSIESMGGNYYGRDRPAEGVHARRESISWAANQLHISGSESDDNTLKSTLENADGLPVTPGRDGQRGVIRRAVTRRGNMLPKTKGFARIRAALAEESAPVETEVRREAEVVRQTRESDMDLEPRHPSISSTTAHSSPSLGPTTQDSLEGIPEDDIMADISSGLSSSFKQHAMRNSKGKEFWDTFTDEKSRTPPPQFLPRGSSSGISDDILLDSPTPPIPGTTDHPLSSPSRSSTPLPVCPTAAEITQKVNKKRRRDDDFDPSSFKRRAVSPGMSAHNSPVMQSPMQRDVTPWGARPSSNGEAGKIGTNGVPKRVGFQGMIDTNDGLMKMSIE